MQIFTSGTGGRRNYILSGNGGNGRRSPYERQILRNRSDSNSSISTNSSGSSNDSDSSGDELGCGSFPRQVTEVSSVGTDYACGPLYSTGYVDGGHPVRIKNVGFVAHRACLALINFGTAAYKVDYTSQTPIISCPMSTESFIKEAVRLCCVGHQVSSYGDVCNVAMHGNMYGNLKGLSAFAGLPKTSRGVEEVGGKVYATITEKFLQPWRDGRGEMINKANGVVREESYLDSIAEASKLGRLCQLNKEELVDLHFVMYEGVLNRVAVRSVSHVHTEMTADDIYSLPGSTLRKFNDKADVIYLNIDVMSEYRSVMPDFLVHVSASIPRDGGQAVISIVTNNCIDYNRFAEAVDMLRAKASHIFNCMLTGNTFCCKKVTPFGIVHIATATAPQRSPIYRNLDAEVAKNIIANGAVNII